MMPWAVAMKVLKERVGLKSDSSHRRREALPVLFATTFWSFRREFWMLDEQFNGEFSVSFQQTAKHTIIRICPQLFAFNVYTTIAFENLFRGLVT